MNRPTNTKRKLSLGDKRHVLARIVRDPNSSTASRLRAIELDSLLAGHFAPERIEVETGPVTLDAIRQLTKQIARLRAGAAPAENPAPGALNP